MKQRKRGQPRSKSANVILAIVVHGALVIGGLVAWQISTRSSDSASASRESDTTFSVPTHVGQPAPAFTAIGVDGAAYSVTPGDGRPKALIFYMGIQ